MLKRKFLVLILLLISYSSYKLFLYYNNTRIQAWLPWMKNDDLYYKFDETLQVWLWIDLPSVLPWRHCLELDSTGHVLVLSNFDIYRSRDQYSQHS